MGELCNNIASTYWPTRHSPFSVRRAGPSSCVGLLTFSSTSTRTAVTLAPSRPSSAFGTCTCIVFPLARLAMRNPAGVTRAAHAPQGDTLAATVTILPVSWGLGYDAGEVSLLLGLGLRPSASL